MKLGSAISRSHLKDTLSRASAELRSKGTIDEPVAKSVGWDRDRLECMYTHLENYSGDDIRDMRASAQGKAKESESEARKWMLGAAGAFAATVAVMTVGPLVAGLAPLLGTAAVAVTGGTAAITGARSMAKFIEASDARETDKELATWENAFQKNFEESALIA